MSKIESLGVIGTSRKENELRLPIHPGHFERIPPAVRKRLRFERGYGERFHVADEDVESLFGRMGDRRELLHDCDGVLLPKPLPEDLREVREGAVIWGWPHCIQQREITRVAVERDLTLLAFEAMFTWRGDRRDMHLFYRNNEMAGYCGVLHALALAGMDGWYGPELSAIVLSFGSVSRGAVYALRNRGLRNITVFTQRPPHAVHDRILGLSYRKMERDDDGAAVVPTADSPERRVPLIEELRSADLIVNGILQDTDRPLMFVRPGDEALLKKGSLIIDVSCDEGMGFPFARPTSFEHPTFSVGHATYYAVDHTPSYSWKSATWEISDVVVQYLAQVLEGPEAWLKDPTLDRAVEILRGEIRNEKILTLQQTP